MLDGILILAAGEGQRMAPFSEQVPKPFFNIDGKPLIQHTIDYARRAFGALPTIVSTQRKHLNWFTKVKNIDSIIINETGTNYYPATKLSGKWAVLCADLLLNIEVDWEELIKKHWVVSPSTIAWVCPIEKPANVHRTGDQLRELWLEREATRIKWWEFVERGTHILSGISFIHANHPDLSVAMDNQVNFAQVWRTLYQHNRLGIYEIPGKGWYTFDSIKEISDYVETHRILNMVVSKEEYSEELRKQIKEVAEQMGRCRV
jgi:NDP-sugar pyrophosphorylase family protein